LKEGSYKGFQSYGSAFVLDQNERSIRIWDSHCEKCFAVCFLLLAHWKHHCCVVFTGQNLISVAARNIRGILHDIYCNVQVT